MCRGVVVIMVSPVLGVGLAQRSTSEIINKYSNHNFKRPPNPKFLRRKLVLIPKNKKNWCKNRHQHMEG